MANLKPCDDPENHVVLLGDSIFDNAAYVPDGTPVIQHLRQIIPADWQATLLAIDGDITVGVAGQMADLPSGATHLVISVGGNDALQASGIFREPVSSVGEALFLLADEIAQFRRNYRQMLWQVLEVNLPVAVCTIYNAIPGLGDMEKTALALFNEAILQEAFTAKIPVIDLRLICNEAEDYSQLSPIEPSHAGGEKIARAIASLLGTHDFASGYSVVISQAAMQAGVTTMFIEKIDLQPMGDVKEQAEANNGNQEEPPLSKEQLEKILSTRMASYPMALRASEEEIQAVRDLYIALAQPEELRPRKYANIYELDNIQSLQNAAWQAYGPNGPGPLKKTDPSEAFGPNGFVTLSRARREKGNSPGQ